MRKSFYPLILLLLLSLIPKAYAANFTVTDAASLIAAINTANTNGEDDVITLANDIVLSAVDNTTEGANGLPDILSDGGNSLTIEGAGFTISRSSAVGTPDFRIMHIDINATVIINQLGIENGLANAGGIGVLGGGIYSAGDVTISESVFTGNVADTVNGFGGAIFINLRDAPVRSFTLSNSTFTGNRASFGGAIYNYQNNGSNLITGNTFSNNTASFGGAIGDEASDTTLINNTISGNTAGTHGGGIYRFGGTSLMQNNTLSNNTAGTHGGGLYNWLGTVSLQNTIVAGNTVDDCYVEVLGGGGTLLGDAYNVFGTSGSANGCPAGATDIVPAGAIGTVLSPLANNGGLNLTHALILTSPAIDAANNSNCPSIDQRGFLRGFDGDGVANSPELADCDIGAFEYSLDPAYDSLPAVGSTLNLGSTPVGTEISTILEISEVGGAALSVSLSSITGANAADFSIIGLPTIIGNGNTPQDVALICAPSASGLRTAQITFTTNDPLQPTVSYALECTGTDSIVASAALLDINQVITEANTTVNVTVQLTVPVGFSNTGDVTVEVIDAATGNAVSGTDYTAFPVTTVTFTGPLTAGTTYTDTVALDIIDDGTIEGAEALALMINQVSSNAEIAFPDTHTLVINDNDANTYAQAAFVGNSALINENAGTLSIDVQVTIPAGFNLTGDISLTISDGLAGNATSGADYTAFAPVTLTFVDLPFVVGTTYTQTITLDILDDAIIEGAETVELAITGISGPVALVSPASFTAIINDDELTTRIITRDGETITVTNGGSSADTDFVFKTVDNPFATVGQTVIYTIRARNPKTIPLTQVVIYDVFDERLTDIQLLSTSHGAGIFNANTLTVSGFTLQPNEEALIVVSARIASLRAGETIPNAAILESPNASVHVSNLALVGDNPVGNSGGAAQVFIVPSQLPSTGESPLWRYGLIVGVGMLLFLGVGSYWLHKRKA